MCAIRRLAVYPPDAAPKDISIVHGVSLTPAKGRAGADQIRRGQVQFIGLSAILRAWRVTNGGQGVLNERDILQERAAGLRNLRGQEVTGRRPSAAAAFNFAMRLM
jgi:peptide/nickel transport system ATP-binding protein